MQRSPRSAAAGDGDQGALLLALSAREADAAALRQQVGALSEELHRAAAVSIGRPPAHANAARRAPNARSALLEAGWLRTLQQQQRAFAACRQQSLTRACAARPLQLLAAKDDESARLQQAVGALNAVIHEKDQVRAHVTCATMCE